MSGIPGEGFNNRQVQLIAVTSTCLVLSTVAVALRFVVRWSSAATLWWDDWVSVLALVASWLVNIFTILGIKYGLGRHSPQVDSSNVTPFGVSVFVQQITWVLSIGLIILAILLFYSRIFPNTWMRKAIYIVGAWDTLWTISTLLVIIFQCHPIDFLWDRKAKSGECINSDAFYFACGVTSTVTVVTVLFLPLPIIWKLQISTLKKTGLAISFTIGAFACIASIIRLVVLLDIDPQDLMYTSALPQLWSCVEASFGVISACLPSLTTLFLTILGKRPSSSRHHSVSFSSLCNGKIRNADFSRIRDGDPGSENLEMGNSTTNSHTVENINANSEGTTNIDESGGSILVTSRLDQTTIKKSEQLPGAEEVAVAADATTLNV